jgi:hypothetical protein
VDLLLLIEVGDTVWVQLCFIERKEGVYQAIPLCLRDRGDVSANTISNGHGDRLLSVVL